MKAIDVRILVQPEKGESIQKIGLLSVPIDQSEYDTATVISVGEKIDSVAVGDKVLIYPMAGKNITVDGEDYRVVTINEIIVVL